MAVPPLLGIISGLLHPPIDLLHLEAHAGNPHSGGYAPLRIRGVRNIDAHGLFWNVNFAPPGFGLTVDFAGHHYDRPVFALQEWEQLLDLTLVASPIFETREAQGVYLLYGQVPQALDIQITPGVTIDFSWLVFF